MCPSCRANGALPIARTKRSSGDAIQRSGRRAHLVPDDEVEEVRMEGDGSGVVAPQDVLRPTRARDDGRGRRRRYSMIYQSQSVSKQVYMLNGYFYLYLSKVCKNLLR